MKSKEDKKAKGSSSGKSGTPEMKTLRMQTMANKGKISQELKGVCPPDMNPIDKLIKLLEGKKMKLLHEEECVCLACIKASVKNQTLDIAIADIKNWSRGKVVVDKNFEEAFDLCCKANKKYAKYVEKIRKNLLTKEESDHFWNSFDNCYWCIDETMKGVKQKDCPICNMILKKIKALEVNGR